MLLIRFLLQKFLITLRFIVKTTGEICSDEGMMANKKEYSVKHITRFIANIWQIHPFGEGNTRTPAVFTIKYLKSLGFDMSNEPFEKNSWYFRNALVRTNYTNMQKGIYMNTEYLERFFRNLLLGESNELKNRYTHIHYDEYIKKIRFISWWSEKEVRNHTESF